MAFGCASSESYSKYFRATGEDWMSTYQAGYQCGLWYRGDGKVFQRGIYRKVFSIWWLGS